MPRSRKHRASSIAVVVGIVTFSTRTVAFAGGENPDDTPAPPSAAASSAVSQIMSQLAEAEGRAAQLRTQTESLKEAVGRRVAAIQQAQSSGGRADAAYVSLQAAVAAAAPAIQTNLSADLRIANTLTIEVAR